MWQEQKTNFQQGLPQMIKNYIALSGRNIFALGHNNLASNVDQKPLHHEKRGK